MNQEMTKFELYDDVQKNYKGFLDMRKALMLFEMEHGYKPTIIKEKRDNLGVTQEVIDDINKEDNTSITVEEMLWMKQMQEKGTYNMIIGEIVSVIQTTFIIDYSEARAVQKAYLNHYTRLYFPEEMI